jgi:hypothetical protein
MFELRTHIAELAKTNGSRLAARFGPKGRPLRWGQRDPVGNYGLVYLETLVASDKGTFA